MLDGASPAAQQRAQAEYAEQQAEVERQRGAIAALVRSIGPPGLQTPHTGTMRYADDVPQIPAAGISTEAADMLARHAARGTRTVVRLDMEARLAPDALSHNVVAKTAWEDGELVVEAIQRVQSVDLVAQSAHPASRAVLLAGADVVYLSDVPFEEHRCIDLTPEVADEEVAAELSSVAGRTIQYVDLSSEQLMQGQLDAGTPVLAVVSQPTAPIPPPLAPGAYALATWTACSWTTSLAGRVRRPWPSVSGSPSVAVRLYSLNLGRGWPAKKVPDKGCRQSRSGLFQSARLGQRYIAQGSCAKMSRCERSCKMRVHSDLQPKPEKYTTAAPAGLRPLKIHRLKTDAG